MTFVCNTNNVFVKTTINALLKQAAWEAATICPRPCKLTFDLWPFDLLTLNLVSESRVTWATSVPISVFLDLSILDL